MRELDRLVTVAPSRCCLLRTRPCWSHNSKVGKKKKPLSLLPSLSFHLSLSLPLDIKMPESPVRTRVRNCYLSDEERMIRDHLNRHLPRLDVEYDDPAHCTPLGTYGNYHEIIRVVDPNSPAPKYKWTNVSCDSAHGPWKTLEQHNHHTNTSNRSPT